MSKQGSATKERRQGSQDLVGKLVAERTEMLATYFRLAGIEILQRLRQVGAETAPGVLPDSGGLCRCRTFCCLRAYSRRARNGAKRWRISRLKFMSALPSPPTWRSISTTNMIVKITARRWTRFPGICPNSAKNLQYASNLKTNCSRPWPVAERLSATGVGHKADNFLGPGGEFMPLRLMANRLPNRLLQFFQCGPGP